MPAIYHYPHRVTAEEIDEQGHVNNLAYLKWLQSAALAHSAAQGWPPERYRAANVAWVVRSHFIEYLQPAFEGDEVVVETWVATMKKVASVRNYRILRPSDNAVLAVAETNWAFVNRTTRAPQRILPELAEAFEIVGDR